MSTTVDLFASSQKTVKNILGTGHKVAKSSAGWLSLSPSQDRRGVALMQRTQSPGSQLLAHDLQAMIANAESTT